MFSVQGTIGPVIPYDFDHNSGVVQMSVGFNTEFFHAITWDLNAETQPEMDFPRRNRKGVLERERYNRLGFASQDPMGRILTSNILPFKSRCYVFHMLSSRFSQQVKCYLSKVCVTVYIS